MTTAVTRRTEDSIREMLLYMALETGALPEGALTKRRNADEEVARTADRPSRV